MSKETVMTVTFEHRKGYGENEWRWTVMTDSEAGFYMTGKADTYRLACRHARKAVKKLEGIHWMAAKINE